MKKKTRRALRKAASSITKAAALLAIDLIGSTVSSALKNQLKGKHRRDDT
jgi:hypothetical protein